MSLSISDAVNIADVSSGFIISLEISSSDSMIGFTLVALLTVQEVSLYLTSIRLIERLSILLDK